jgi:hypothetical protein
MALSGCTTGGGAIVQTVTQAVLPQRAGTTPQLNPNFDYIRVLANGRLAFLAKDRIPGDSEIWYSGDLEVFRMNNGRLTGATGTTTEWRRVVIPELPAWRTLANTAAFDWHRSRDVMPGYLFGIEEDIQVRAVQPPSKTNLVALNPQQFTWFEERITSATPLPLPPALYAVDLAANRVFYAEQCLAVDFCFTWQRWSPEGPVVAVSQ